MLFLRVLLLSGSLFLGVVNSQAMYCGEIYSQGRISAPDFVQFIRPRLGGSEKNWNRFVESLLYSRTPEELVEVSEIFRNTQSRSWFARTANSLLFFRLQAVFSTIEALYMKQIDLSETTKWSHLSLAERRAMLLLAFQKWWWQVDSPHVMGFGKWADFAFLTSRFVHRQIPETSLALRLHELLAGPSQAGFIGTLLGRFRTEYEVLQQLKNDSEGMQVISQILVERIKQLIALRDNSALPQYKKPLMNLVILRTAVLKEMLKTQRSLSLFEVQMLADQLGLSRSLIAGSRMGLSSLNLFPSLAPRVTVQMVAEWAAIALIAYIYSEIFWDETQSPEFEMHFSDYEKTRGQ